MLGRGTLGSLVNWAIDYYRVVPHSLRLGEEGLILHDSPPAEVNGTVPRICPRNVQDDSKWQGWVEHRNCVAGIYILIPSIIRAQ